MTCLECKDMARHFAETLARYQEARGSAYYRVSTELAARREVDMERARTALEEHRMVCVAAKPVALISLR